MKEYVDNNVWEWGISLKREISTTYETIYTKPFPQMPLFTTAKEYEDEIERRENLVQEKYFTPERIQEYKDYFCKLIQESENPFNIFLNDTDSGYDVTKEQLFNLD